MQPQHKKLVTPAAYAKRRGVTRSTISRQIGDGLIPTTSNGLIEVEAADEALAKRAALLSRRGTLADAQRRKLRAAVAILQDEVDYLVSHSIRPDDAIRVLTAHAAKIKWPFEQLIGDVAPRVAGLPAAEADAIVTAAVHGVLEALSSDPDVDEPVKSRAKRRPKKMLLTARDLAAAKADLQATILEYKRWLRRGELIDIDHQVVPVLHDTLLRFRSRVLAVPTRTAPHFEACSAAEAARVLRRAIDEALAELDQPIRFSAWRPDMLTKPPALPDNEITDEQMARIEAEEEERWLDRAYQICASFAGQQAGWLPQAPGETVRHRPPQWRRDWPLERPAGWKPPEGLVADMKAHWSSPSCCPFGYDERIAELGLIPPYKPT
jgi:hypothetical protein